MPTFTKWRLANLLFSGQDENKFYANGRLYSLHAVERESGGGNKFNIYVSYVDGLGHTVHETIYISTID